uniref:Uncharacterized protein n=1 Tax=Pseudo-nitzschia australis TaxID=44445 RepID=A0A6U9YP95_9STRA|mmetsp:Transcript_23107/g.47094  ORF Transcript_23107/g.47094 Transcript_23107/m.47094 type:complete len:307 (+) Transcript_23107:111-1031(+)
MKSHSPTILFAILSLALHQERAAGFSRPNPPSPRCATRPNDGRIAMSTTTTEEVPDASKDNAVCANNNSRRQWIYQTTVATLATISIATSTSAPAAAEEAPQKMFAPGGTLVDYQVGIRAGNAKASASRRNDNSNVIFGQDYYYKFGTAPAFIPEGDTSFPVKMPFVLSQQRYDGLKKYRDRVQRGIDKVAALEATVGSGDFASIAPADDPEYSIRPMGLLANAFLASENTGTTNELFLARWYINEIYLDIADIKSAQSKEAAETSRANAVLALNSFLGMLNRSITAKVGDPFVLVGSSAGSGGGI